MRVANWTNPQFVDATSISGLNAAFALVSGTVSSVGSGVWALPGLLSPQAMGLTFSGMVGSVSLASPWGLVNASGVVVRAHGAQTGQDTTSYTVDFSTLVPATGTVTAYLNATVTTIQQNAFPLTGPPQGHPSYNPNFVPTIAYASIAYTVSLAASTGVADNLSTFELARTTLTPSQNTINTFSVQGWRRASPYTPVPAGVLASGGSLTLAQTQQVLLPGAVGMTSTLPAAVSGGGLYVNMVNPSTTSSWTVAAPAGTTIAGAGSGTAVSSVGIPPLGAMTVWGNAASGVWEITSANPQMMSSLPNVFTAPQTIVDSSGGALTIIGSGAAGANLRLAGNGTSAPNKYIRSNNGVLNVVNSLYTAAILSLDDVGNFNVQGSVTGAGLAIAGGGSFGAGLRVTAGGIFSGDFDGGGLNIRTAAGAGAGAGFRNDGTTFYLLLSNAGSPAGGFNGLRPMYVNLASGSMVLDGTGAGVNFGGAVGMPSLTANTASIGAVSFTGGGAIFTNGAITSASQIGGNTLVSTGNITSNAGRLRATLGAANSGDPNAAVLLLDFLKFTGGVGGTWIYETLPDGTTIQAYSGSSVTGIGDQVTFPRAFPTTCSQVVVCEGSPAGWYGSPVQSTPTFLTIFGSQNATSFGFGLFIGKISAGGTMTAGSNIAYRYIAIGF